MNPTIEEYKKAMTTPIPNCAVWIDEINDKSWGFGKITIHRNSSVLEESNWEVLLKRLKNQSEFEGKYKVVKFSCSLVGWVKHLIIDMSCEPLISFMFEQLTYIENCMFLDSDHYYAAQYESDSRFWEEDLKPSYINKAIKQINEEFPRLIPGDFDEEIVEDIFDFESLIDDCGVSEMEFMEDEVTEKIKTSLITHLSR